MLGIMGMIGGGGGLGSMIPQLLQTAQQMLPQQSGGAEQCSQGGGQDIVAQLFQQALQLAQGQGQGQG